MGCICQFLLYICFCEMIVAMGEFDAVEFDIGSGLCGKGIMCLEAFNEKDG